MIVVQKPLKRGYDFFFWGYIHQVKLQQVDRIWYVQSQCWDSQRKSTNYHQKLTLISNSSQLNVDYASCVPCPAGTNGGLHMSACICTSVGSRKAFSKVG